MNNHIRDYHNNENDTKIYQCTFNECNLTFLTLTKLNEHKNDHNNPELKCIECNFITRNSDYFKIHLKQAHTDNFKNIKKISSTSTTSSSSSSSSSEIINYSLPSVSTVVSYLFIYFLVHKI